MVPDPLVGSKRYQSSTPASTALPKVKFCAPKVILETAEALTTLTTIKRCRPDPMVCDQDRLLWVATAVLAEVAASKVTPAPSDGETDGETDRDPDALGLRDADGDGLWVALGLKLGELLVKSDGEAETLTELDGLRDGEFDGLTETLGLTELDGESDGEIEADCDSDLDGLSDLDGETLGDLDGETLGDLDGLGEPNDCRAIRLVAQVSDVNVQVMVTDAAPAWSLIATKTPLPCWLARWVWLAPLVGKADPDWKPITSTTRPEMLLVTVADDEVPGPPVVPVLLTKPDTPK